MRNILAILFFMFATFSYAEDKILLSTMTVTSTATSVEEPALPPDQISEQLPVAPEWVITALNKFPIAILIMAIYLAGLAFFKTSAEALLWYSRTTESKKDDDLAAKLGKYARIAAAPLALLGGRALKDRPKKEA